MRIISGAAKGRKLKSPEKLEIRPTLCQIKEMIFNVLRFEKDLEESNFLDLFSGSGGIGLEALSRGSQKVFFVEKNKLCVKLIRKNLEMTGLEKLNRSEIICNDAREVIKKLARREIFFDIIFLDPPYYKNLAKEILIILSEIDLLNKNGIIVCETGRKEILPEIDTFDFFKLKEYSNTRVSFIRKK